jgi:tetratricopeptide (TPR) repeat protein
MSFTKHDYAAAIQDYQRITQNASTLPELHDAAQIGLASAQEATGKIDDAISTYLSVAQLGTKSPFAPYAYNAAARLYEQQGNKDKEREILTEAASLDPDSPFVKDAQNKLKQMTATAQPPLSVPLPATPAPAAPAPAPNPSTPPASASAPAPVQK